ncbi:MAG: polyprenyl synthetase family protein [Rhodospirillaceae bacterium]|nr:polyprenyl synthetase family protein [Rhodospirillaceae bacterium]
MNGFDLGRHMAETGQEVERMLERLLPGIRGTESRLFEAMRYACLGGGKRLRPYLVMASSGLFGVGTHHALRVAAAIECVHCYSLVHDDLPAMDDDDFRRGRPTVHKAYDDATAILAGDALLTLAFEIVADPDTHEDPQVRVSLATALAKAAGAAGMVGGQMLDMLAEEEEFDIGAVTRLQRLKTGELFAFSCEAGAILGKSDPSRRNALRGYAHDMGLAFQIADDLLDVTGREEDLGKAVGKDAAAGKATFVSILGEERAREQAHLLADQAIRHLEIFDKRADPLRAVATFVVARRA